MWLSIKKVIHGRLPLEECSFLVYGPIHIVTKFIIVTNAFMLTYQKAKGKFIHHEWSNGWLHQISECLLANLSWADIDRLAIKPILPYLSRNTVNYWRIVVVSVCRPLVFVGYLIYTNLLLHTFRSSDIPFKPVFYMLWYSGFITYIWLCMKSIDPQCSYIFLCFFWYWIYFCYFCTCR